MERGIEPKGFQFGKWTKEIVERLYQAGLLEFLRKFDGYNAKVTKEFISNYQDENTIVGDVTIPIIEEYLSHATDQERNNPRGNISRKIGGVIVWRDQEKEHFIDQKEFQENGSRNHGLS